MKTSHMMLVLVVIVTNLVLYGVMDVAHRWAFDPAFLTQALVMGISISAAHVMVCRDNEETEFTTLALSAHAVFVSICIAVFCFVVLMDPLGLA